MSHSREKPPHNERDMEERHSKKTYATKVRKKSPLNTFQKALKGLDDALQNLPQGTHHSMLFVSGYDVYVRVHWLSSHQHNRISQETLTEILSTAARLVAGNEVHSGDDEGYRDDLIRFQSLANQIHHFPFGRMLASLLLALIGTAVIVASGIIAAASFGFLAPFSVLGFVFGASMIIGGVAVGVGALGIASVMTSGIILFSSNPENELSSRMKQLKTDARLTYGFGR